MTDAISGAGHAHVSEQMTDAISGAVSDGCISHAHCFGTVI